MAEGGWLGNTMPAEYGGAGLGVTEAAADDARGRQPRRRHGGGERGPHQPVRAAPDRGLRHAAADGALDPGLVQGLDQVAFGFTEPDAGLNTTAIGTWLAAIALADGSQDG